MTRILSLLRLLAGIAAKNFLLFVAISLLIFFFIDQIPVADEYDEWSAEASGIQQRYLNLTWRVLTLDMGRVEGLPVKVKILHGLWITGALTIGAILVCLVLGFSLGLLAHLKKESRLWRAVIVIFDWVSLVPIFITGYFISLLLYTFFSVSTDLTSLEQTAAKAPYIVPFLVALPALILGIGDGTISEILRNTREELAKVQEKWYMQAVKANGGKVLTHLIRAAILPVLLTLNLRLVHLLGGVIVVEKIFNLKGLGWLTLEGVNGNRELLFAVSIVIVLMILTVNLINELLIHALDPLVREKRTDETNL